MSKDGIPWRWESGNVAHSTLDEACDLIGLSQGNHTFQYLIPYKGLTYPGKNLILVLLSNASGNETTISENVDF